MHRVLINKNPVLNSVKLIRDIYCEKNETLLQTKMTVSDIEKMKFARITSVEVKCSFSWYKSMLQSNHRAFNFDNLSNMFIVYSISLLSISRRIGSI